MKLQSQAIIGFSVGAVLTVGIVGLIFVLRPATPVYKSARIYGNVLKNLYNGNFSTLNLNFRTNPSDKSLELVPQVFNASGTAISTPAGLFTTLTKSAPIAGSRDLPAYTLEQNRVHNYVQLQRLVAIMADNPGGYLDFNAADYVNIDPTDKTHIYYTITAYDGNGNLARVNGELPPRLFELNPSPPGRMY